MILILKNIKKRRRKVKEIETKEIQAKNTVKEKHKIIK